MKFIANGLRSLFGRRKDADTAPPALILEDPVFAETDTSVAALVHLDQDHGFAELKSVDAEELTELFEAQASAETPADVDWDAAYSVPADAIDEDAEAVAASDAQALDTEPDLFADATDAHKAVADIAADAEADDGSPEPADEMLQPLAEAAAGDVFDLDSFATAIGETPEDAQRMLDAADDEAIADDAFVGDADADDTTDHVDNWFAQPQTGEVEDDVTVDMQDAAEAEDDAADQTAGSDDEAPDQTAGSEDESAVLTAEAEDEATDEIADAMADADEADDPLSAFMAAAAAVAPEPCPDAAETAADTQVAEEALTTEAEPSIPDMIAECEAEEPAADAADDESDQVAASDTDDADELVAAAIAEAEAPVAGDSATAEAPIEVIEIDGFDPENDVIGVFYTKEIDAVTGKPITPKVSVSAGEDGCHTISLDGYDFARVVGAKRLDAEQIALIEH